MIDIEKVRKETPGCKNRIHFNNAGSSFSPQAVIDAVKNHLNLEQEMGGYEAANKEFIKIEKFYLNTAELIGCKSNEVAFVENATRAWDMIFYSLPFKRGDKIVTDVAEYASNYIAMLQLSKKLGLEIEVIPDDKDGQVDLDKLKKSMDGKVKLVALTHIPTNNGLINPAKKVGEIAKEANAYYLLDACQSLGQVNVKVDDIGCDFLCGTGRKYLRGPRGTGLLYVRGSLIEKIEPVFLDLHAATWTSMHGFKIRNDARRFENWECHVAGKLGLATAIGYCNQLGIENIEKRVQELAKSLRQSLAKIPSITVLDKGCEKSGLVTFTAPFNIENLQKELELSGINTSVSYLEYARLDFEPKNLKMVLRASVHYYNTLDEIEKLCSKVSEILRR